MDEVIGSPPISSLEARQAELVSLAMRQAEAQLKAGTAPPSVVVALLRIGSVSEQVELERLRANTALAQAKAVQIETTAHMDVLADEVLKAMRGYGGYFNQEEGVLDGPPPGYS